MKIIYNKKTGEVIGTVEGFDDISHGINILPQGADPADIASETISLGDPKEPLARRLLDPQDDLSIEFLKVTKEGVVEVGADEKKQIKAKRQADFQKAKDAEKNSVSPLDKIYKLLEDVQTRLAKLEDSNSKKATK